MLTVVTGPPCAGKTTYVREHAAPGDIVLDMDAIANALHAGPATRRYGRALLAVTLRAHTAALVEALRQSARVDVWVIHTQPSEAAMQQYVRHAARVVVVNPGRAIVMRRIAEQRPATARSVATRWYRWHAATDITSSDLPAERPTTSREW
ncbi:hypothetical protein amrb99_97770 [Actinomadura sp. RB99]|uniref:AAA family ATPase n=1 Tax=Actinomadura sp. RB99 TaxID=2691577 RepID=UPI001688EB8B|nr:AAA family ATPase [Actinomadura sp. RB99]MBD2900768.1 hypothetical protein [Actinomadura sp. RB99]